MRGDAEQPRRELRGRLVALPRLIDAQEYFLAQFLGHALVLHHAVQKMNDRRPMAVQQEREAGLIAVANP